VSEDGQWSETKVGTPQGAVVSPLLANIYLHYAFDLWVEAWRKKVAQRDVIVVRYADDLVVGFESRAEAERFLGEFRERLAKFGLELHAEKLLQAGARPNARKGSDFARHCHETRSVPPSFPLLKPTREFYARSPYRPTNHAQRSMPPQ